VTPAAIAARKSPSICEAMTAFFFRPCVTGRSGYSTNVTSEKSSSRIADLMPSDSVGFAAV
jgi:hypothetical protein